MPLVNLTTDLKSLRYGRDRRDGASSGQPYITTPIPTGDINPALEVEDFLLRGGTLAPGRSVQDVSRLNKMFTDLKSPNGILFTAKQEILSRTSVNIKAKDNSNAGFLSNFNPFDSNRLPLNNGVYLPTSTLAQAGVNAFGGHLLKQGINPFASTSESNASGGVTLTNFLNRLPLRNPIYFETDAAQERFQANNGGETLSRLVSFYNTHIIGNSNGKNILYDYSGGPGSVVGVGKTNIRLASDRTGRNNGFLNNNSFFGTQIKTPGGTFLGNIIRAIFGGTLSNTVSGSNPGFEDYSIFKNPRNINFQGAKIFNPSSVSRVYETLMGVNLLDVVGQEYKTTNDDINTGEIKEWSNNVFQDGFISNTANVRGLGTTLDYGQLMNSVSSGSINDGGKNNIYTGRQILQDFRQNLSDQPQSPDYLTENIENRVSLGNPGGYSPTQKLSYSKGITDPATGKPLGALDKITGKVLYKNDIGGTTFDSDLNDLVKFRIGVIDNNDPSKKTYMHFRAFINEMSDSYNATWDTQKYMGRGENFYNYQGYDRSVNLGWTVVAQSKPELMVMYQKLNYMASMMAPDYSKFGYMRGNLVTLTVGGYFFEQPGIVTSFTYEIPTDSPWEVAIDENGGSDQSVKEMPHRINVSGFNFIPIEKFVPRVQQNTFGEIDANQNSGSALPTDKGEGVINNVGKEHFIALTNGYTTNYGPTGNPTANSADYQYLIKDE